MRTCLLNSNPQPPQLTTQVLQLCSHGNVPQKWDKQWAKVEQKDTVWHSLKKAKIFLISCSHSIPSSLPLSSLTRPSVRAAEAQAVFTTGGQTLCKTGRQRSFWKTYNTNVWRFHLCWARSDERTLLEEEEHHVPVSHRGTLKFTLKTETRVEEKRWINDGVNKWTHAGMCSSGCW